MAFCAFDEGAAGFDVTPVENMFISEYMLGAPGEYVKVYLYGLMLMPYLGWSLGTLIGAVAGQLSRRGAVRRLDGRVQDREAGAPLHSRGLVHHGRT